MSTTRFNNDTKQDSFCQDGAEPTAVQIYLSKIPKVLTLPNTTPNWIVPGLIVEKGFHLITGAPGAMKSLLSLYIAGQINSGGELFGTQLQQKLVIYFDLENPAVLIQKRFLDLGISEDNLSYCGTWLPEAHLQLGDPMYNDIAKELHPVMIFDSLVRFHQSDENHAKEMSVVTKYFRRLCNLGATVIVLHHTGKPKLEGPTSPFRGSSEIAAACDIGVKIAMFPTETGATLELRAFKNRFEPLNEMTCRFDGHAGQFLLEKSEKLITPSLLDQIMECIDAEHVIDVAGLFTKTKIPEKKLRSLLKQGEILGKWKSEAAAHGKLLYLPVSIH